MSHLRFTSKKKKSFHHLPSLIIKGIKANVSPIDLRTMLRAR